jgi:polar amino acid transport system substrate-binding protein
MATDLGATPMYVSPSGSGMLAGVKAGQIDIISEAVTNTPTRALSYFFSNPYYPSLTVLLVRKADKKASYDDYNQTSVKVAAELGSTQASYLSFYFPKAQADLLTGVSTVALEVSSGRAAGAVMDSADASSYIHSNPDVTYFSLDNPLGFEYGALVSQYGDWEFKNWIDEWTRYWNARGFFQTTYDKYYNSILPAQLLSTLKIPRY